MTASLASAMINARERGLALISASLASRDFMGQPRINTNEHESENDPPPIPAWRVRSSSPGDLTNLVFQQQTRVSIGVHWCSFVVKFHTFTFASVSFRA